MIEHAEARELISARADGELDPVRAADLDAHLDTCASCSAFAAGLERLHAAARTLPVERAPAGLELRVRRARARRRIPKATAAVAAVLAIAVFFVATQPTAGFRLPGAEAARALTEIETLYVDRTIERHENFGEIRFTVRERIWFRAPDLIRIERTLDTSSTKLIELVIERTGERYERKLGGEVSHLVALAPDAQRPIEPLTTTIAVLGTPIGRGPNIAGRPTTRYVVTTDGEERIALIDTERFALLGTEPVVVLEKVRSGATVRTRTVRYNEPIPDARFRIPTGVRSIDRGFRAIPIHELMLVPGRVPDGFVLQRSGTTPRGEYVTYVHGAFAILVTSSVENLLERLPDARSVSVGSRPGFVNTPLYGVPYVVFELAGRQVRVQAPLAPEDLVELAEEMFPE